MNQGTSVEPLAILAAYSEVNGMIFGLMESCLLSKNSNGQF